MNRYTYRAKEFNSNSKWVYGSYLKFLPYTPNPLGKPPREEEYEHLIVREGFSDWNLPRGLSAFKVDASTVSQCTGSLDKNNVPIYENDIVVFGHVAYIVTWKYDKFILKSVEPEMFDQEFPDDSSLVQVIGNIFETSNVTRSTL